MAADVTTLVRIMSEYTKGSAGDEKATRDSVTRDFLGCFLIGSKELDLDLKAPSGWERRLDLLSGETYLEKSGPVHRQMHDLNMPPPTMPPPPLDDSALDLRLLLPPAAHPRSEYQSVCTLDKVRSALERVGRESRGKIQPQQRSDGSASQSSTTTTTSVKKRSAGDQEAERRADGSGSPPPSGLVAAGCPSCLMYVLISKGDPRCPRCDSHVPSPAPAPAVSKKPRIDLNSL